MKKQNFIITSLFLFWVIGITTAQTITGKVTNIHAQAIDGATVILQTIDSTFVDAVITDTTGYFRFNRQPASYRLIFQHIMYETLLLTTTGEDAGTITLKSKDYALDEVIVKGERPLVKVEEGKLSYDLSQLTTHRIVNNAYEILQQLPGCTGNKRQPFISRHTQSEHYFKRKAHNNESRTVDHFIKKHSGFTCRKGRNYV